MTAPLSPDALTSLSTGIHCWPQWRGWLFCPRTGDLIDPNGQAYGPGPGPGTVQAGQLMLQLQEVRDRVIFADSGPRRPLVAVRDMADPIERTGYVALADASKQPCGRHCDSAQTSLQRRDTLAHHRGSYAPKIQGIHRD
jgi:hypothetical protein